jgi:hypothetical protein
MLDRSFLGSWVENNDCQQPCGRPACECFRYESGTPLDMPRAAFVIVLSADMHHFSLQNLRLLSQPFVSSTEDIQHSRYERLLEATSFRRRYALISDD